MERLRTQKHNRTKHTATPTVLNFTVTSFVETLIG